MLRARFEDAQFFYAADLRQPLEAFLPKLAGTQFHKALGNLLQKSERVAGLIRPLAELTGLTGSLPFLQSWTLPFCCKVCMPLIPSRSSEVNRRGISQVSCRITVTSKG